MGVKKLSISVAEMDINGLGTVKPGIAVNHPIVSEGVIKDLALRESGDRTILVGFS